MSNPVTAREFAKTFELPAGVRQSDGDYLFAEAYAKHRSGRLLDLLQVSKIRIGILLDRMRGCDEMNGQKHEVSIPEGEAWMKDIDELIGVSDD